MTLYEIHRRWIEKHDAMRRQLDPENRLLAAPFLSVPDPTVRASRLPPIMVVGQATRGDWRLDDFKQALNLPIRQRVRERRATTLEFLTKPWYEKYKRSDFWRFFAALKNGTSAPVVWTNLAKVGVQKGNPKWHLIEGQKELACRTLLAEIAFYKPALVVVATGLFGRYEVVCDVFGFQRDTCSGVNGMFSHRSHTLSQPAILWTGHPGRKAEEITSAWIGLACNLYEEALKNLGHSGLALSHTTARN